MHVPQIISEIDKKPPLDFGAIFSRSIDLFQKVWLQGFMVVLLNVITILPFYIIFYIPLIAAGITDPEAFRSQDPPTMVLVGMAILLPVLLLGIMTFTLALNAAFLRICKAKDLGLAGYEDYFYFFKGGRMGRVFQVALLMLGLSIIGFVTCGIGMLYLMVPMSLFPAFLAFNETMTGMDVVKASFALGNKNWLVIFGLLIVMGFLAQLGVFICLVGVLFTAMLARVPVYFMYKDGAGFEKVA